ncbi:hypothetical protein PMAYCL1PPCAC_09716 [Pristionchus mayeri]|uniref:Brain protein I3 n=1 Tax=Pristionchus mayeri TaxID=1317129 RepID=A0AAN4ZI56_9BILA|nr:hypothetical protein PMAYCL1PPCAC_09716 [Pristionchus mayeri]
MNAPPAYPSAAAYPSAPPVQVVVPAPPPGCCRNCGGIVTVDDDTGCLICAIIMSIVCFPCRLLALCCLTKSSGYGDVRRSERLTEIKYGRLMSKTSTELE